MDGNAAVGNAEAMTLLFVKHELRIVMADEHLLIHTFFMVIRYVQISILQNNQIAIWFYISAPNFLLNIYSMLFIQILFFMNPDQSKPIYCIPGNLTSLN